MSVRIILTIILIAIIATLFASPSPRTNVLNTSAATPGNSRRAKVADPEPTTAPTPESVRQINKDPVSIARAFYEFYLDGSPKMEGNEVIFMRFLTPRFYDKAEKEQTYDPFLDTQEGDPTWKDNISVSDPVIKGNKATLFVVLNGKTNKWRAKLTLLKKNGTWKIDVIDMAVP